MEDIKIRSNPMVDFGFVKTKNLLKIHIFIYD